MMKIHTCAIHIASRQTMTKHSGRARNKYTTLPGATSREWIYAQVPARASKMVDQYANTAATQILYLHEEAVLWKTPHFKSSDCSAEAIHRSSWQIRYCLEKSNRTHPHPTTVTLRRMRAEGSWLCCSVIEEWQPQKGDLDSSFQTELCRPWILL